MKLWVFNYSLCFQFLQVMLSQYHRFLDKCGSQSFATLNNIHDDLFSHCYPYHHMVEHKFNFGKGQGEGFFLSVVNVKLDAVQVANLILQ